jgi:hypothetical protein
MAEIKKISQNELESISYIKKESLDIASVLGELNYQKILLDTQLEVQKVRVLDLRKYEETLLKELKEKYGNINVDLQTGEYTEIG